MVRIGWLLLCLESMREYIPCVPASTTTRRSSRFSPRSTASGSSGTALPRRRLSVASCRHQNGIRSPSPSLGVDMGEFAWVSHLLFSVATCM
jgi:hypothetical protein